MKKVATLIMIFFMSLILISCKKEKEDLTPKFKINVDEINVKIGEKVKIDYTLTKDLVVYWIESESYLVEVTDDNELIGLEEGSLILRGEVVGHSDLFDEVKVNVIKKSIEDYEKTASGLANYILDNTYDLVIPQDITYYGEKQYTHKIGKSVGSYLFDYDINITRNMLEVGNRNNPNKKLDSLEWITIHDTAMSEEIHNAKYISDFTGSEEKEGIASWHYSTGNDGIYQQIENDMVGWHAGDGTQTKFEFYKTDIKATKLFPLVTISKDGYYEIEGQVTKVKAPNVVGRDTPNNSDINTNGIRAVVGDDGYYHLPKTGTHGFGNGTRISMFGGNNNSIGIEMAINKGSNVWLTWQLTAKFVATLLVDNNLNIDRVVTHNHFSNKTCPRTMMVSNNMEAFYEMIEVEYNVLKHYKDYKVEFISDSEFVDSQGLITNVPTKNSEIKYKIKVTSPTGEVVELEKTLPVRIAGL